MGRNHLDAFGAVILAADRGVQVGLFGGRMHALVLEREHAPAYLKILVFFVFRISSLVRLGKSGQTDRRISGFRGVLFNPFRAFCACFAFLVCSWLAGWLDGWVEGCIHR